VRKKNKKIKIIVFLLPTVTLFEGRNGEKITLCDYLTGI
jgi:hypothetical protein